MKTVNTTGNYVTVIFSTYNNHATCPASIEKRFSSKKAAEGAYARGDVYGVIYTAKQAAAAIAKFNKEGGF